MRRRLSFWKDALVKGAPTGWALVGAITVVGGGSLLTFAGFGLSRPGLGAAILAVFVGTIFAEGAYRTWNEAEAKRIEAERKAEVINTRAGLIDFLTEAIEEARILLREFDEIDAHNQARVLGVTGSVSDLSGRVLRQLRPHAPQHVDYWLRNRDDWQMIHPETEHEKAAYRDNVLTWTEEQLEHIKAELS